MYKIKKPYMLSKAVVMITGIILLSFMGISYAAWSDNLEISSAIGIGKTDPRFSDTYSSLSTEKRSINFDSTRTQADLGELILYIEEAGEKISFSLRINNEGTVPIKTEGITINQGVSIELESHQIDPDGYADATLTIEALEVGEYDFNTNPIKILYKQNMASEGWEKELYMKGKVVVKELRLDEVPDSEEVEGLENGLEPEETFPETVGVEPEETLPETVGVEPDVEESLPQSNDTNLEVEEREPIEEISSEVKEIQSGSEQISQGVIE